MIDSLHWSDLFLTLYAHADFTPSVFSESKTEQSPTSWRASRPLSPTSTRSAYLPYAHSRVSYRGRGERPMVRCNGTSRWSLIGLDHLTSLGDGYELVVVSQWGGRG